MTKAKYKPQYSTVPSHNHPIFEMAGAGRGQEPASDLLGADITQLQVHSRFSPQPAFLSSLGCKRRKLNVSCRTFWPEASLNEASFGLAFLYWLWDAQPANLADWHWAGTLCLSLTSFVFSFCSTQLPLILCFYCSILLAQVQMLLSVRCSKPLK